MIPQVSGRSGVVVVEGRGGGGGARERTQRIWVFLGAQVSSANGTELNCNELKGSAQYIRTVFVKYTTGFRALGMRGGGGGGAGGAHATYMGFPERSDVISERTGMKLK